MQKILVKMKKLRLSSKARKAFRDGSRGFSMLEVVIAIALLGIIGVSVLAALQTAALALISTDRRATAEGLARSQMEFIKEQDYIDYSADGHPDYDLISISDGEYEIQLVVQELVTEEDQGKLQKIEVIVIYDIIGAQNKQVERELTLEDYKRE
jgi:prepilin-type N-terminal cleavage/methylation domain-containing protein